MSDRASKGKGPKEEKKIDGENLKRPWENSLETKIWNFSNLHFDFCFISILFWFESRWTARTTETGHTLPFLEVSQIAWYGACSHCTLTRWKPAFQNGVTKIYCRWWRQINWVNNYGSISWRQTVYAGRNVELLNYQLLYKTTFHLKTKVIKHIHGVTASFIF